MASLEDIVVKILGDTTQYQRSMQEAANVTAATGMTIEQVLGAALAANAQQMVTTAVGAAQLTAQVNRLNQSMAEQAATFGMTARQAAIARLELRGATADELQQARVADALLTRRELERAQLQAQQAAVRSLDAQKTRALEAELRNQERLQQANDRRIQREIEAETRRVLAAARAREAQEAAQQSRGAGRGQAVLGTAFTAAVGFGQSMTSDFAEFDLAMTRSTSIMKVTTNEMSQMRDTALELSKSFAFSPTQIAQAFYFLASSGMNANQVMAATPTILNFATAGSMELAQAANYATAATSALGLASKDTQINLQNMTNVIDVVTKASKISLGTTQQYAQALTRDAGAAMKAYHIDLSEGVAVIAAYNKAGLQGAIAGNTFGRAVRLMAGASVTAAKAHRELGFSVYDSAGKMRPLADVIENLENILGRHEEEAIPLVLRRLGFETLAQKAILPLVGQSAQIREFQGQLRAAGGTAESIAQKQMKAFSNQMEILWNHVKVAAISIGAELAPAMRGITSILSTLSGVWNAIPPNLRTVIALVGELTVGIIGLTFALSKLPLLWAEIAAAARVAWGILAANPIVALVVGLGAFLATAPRLIATVIGWTDSFGGLGDAIERDIELSKEINSVIAQRGSRIVQEAATKGTPEAQREFLTPRLGSAEKDVASYTEQMKKLQKEWASISQFKRDMASIGSLLTGEDTPTQKLETQMDNIASKLANSTSLVKQLKEALDKLKEPTAEQKISALTEEIKAATAKAIEAAKYAGKSPTERAIGEFSARGGNVTGLRFAMAYQDIREASEKANKEAEHFAQNLDLEAKTVGKTKREIEIYKMALDGAKDAKLAFAIASAKQADKLEEEHILFEKSRHLQKELLTPVEQYQEKQLELQKMLSKGYITQEQYNRGVQSAAKHLGEARSQAHGFNAALIGSGEAMRRLLQQQWSLEPIAPGIQNITESRLPKRKPTYDLPDAAEMLKHWGTLLLPKFFGEPSNPQVVKMLEWLSIIAANTSKAAKPGVVPGPDVP